MAYDPYYASDPSDSGLLDGQQTDFKSSTASAGGSVPRREAYRAPEPTEVDASAPEESLRDVPLPEGFMTRLRGFVDGLEG